MTNDLNILANMWKVMKSTEDQAKKERREIEDKIKEVIGFSDIEKTETINTNKYKIKLTGRVDRKVNVDKLQEIAIENGLEDYLTSLFKWKAEPIMSVWRATDVNITKILAPAITEKPGRPSFSIELIQEEK